MKKPLFLCGSFLTVATIIYAMNIETGKEFPNGYTEKRSPKAPLENMLRVGGDVMGVDYYLDQASKKITDLKNYIKKQQNLLNTSKFASAEGRSNFRNEVKRHIQGELETIKKGLSEAQERGTF